MNRMRFASNITPKTLSALVALITATLLAYQTPTLAGSISFTDNFSPPSPLWNNLTGSWTASSGDYFAQVPNNNPEAVTILPFDLTSYSLTVTVNSLGDGGILVRTNSTETQYVLLVFGGFGYGQGNRGGGAGSSLYWADSNNPGATMNTVSNVFTPGDTYTITVTDVGDTFSAFVNGVLTSTITDSVGGSDGGVGLYDDQPNTTTGNGFGPPTTFSNFSLTGTTVSSVPDTGTTSSLLGLSLTALAFLRRQLR